VPYDFALGLVRDYTFKYSYAFSDFPNKLVFDCVAMAKPAFLSAFTPMRFPTCLLRSAAFALLLVGCNSAWAQTTPVAASTATAAATPTAATANAVLSAIASDKSKPQGRKTAKDAASDAITLIKTMRADTEFLGPGLHVALANDLATLDGVANDVSHDDGKDSAATKGLTDKFIAAINQMISRLNSTVRSAQESDDNKAKCNRWREQWTNIRVSFQPAAKTAQQAASDAIILIKTMRADTEFLGPGLHVALAKDLTTLDGVANDVSHDDGKDSAATKGLTDKFIAAINQMISRLNSTARRAQESDDNKAKCNRWREQWTNIRVSFQPDTEKMPVQGKGTADNIMSSGAQ